MLFGTAPLSQKADFTGFSLKASAEDSTLAAEGQCGENVYWTFDEATGKLTISGTGDMYETSPFRYNTDIKEVVITNGVTSIGDSAFYDCTSITNIVIPDSVTSIGSYAFEGCENLKNITISENLTSIGDSAFSGCTSLTSLVFPDVEDPYGSEGIDYISSNAFSNCTGLTSVKIGNSVCLDGYGIFSDCTGLTNVEISEYVI